jgi:hypothetical protein
VDRPQPAKSSLTTRQSREKADLSLIFLNRTLWSRGLDRRTMFITMRRDVASMPFQHPSVREEFPCRKMAGANGTPDQPVGN